jgi:acetyltransferase-like isoleucine patch superfamily enzyme
VSLLFKRVALGLVSPLALIAKIVSPVRRLWAHARLRAEIGPRLHPSVVVLGPPEVHGTRQILLGRNLFIYPGVYLETRGDGVIEIGDNVVLSRGVHIVSYSRIEIGANSMIGEYTSIRDANHRRDSDSSFRQSGHSFSPIRIGANVWIGRGVGVLAGACVGDDAILGANAVVTKHVEAGSVVGGVPARILRSADAMAHL